MLVAPAALAVTVSAIAVALLLLVLVLVQVSLDVVVATTIALFVDNEYTYAGLSPTELPRSGCADGHWISSGSLAR